MKVALVCDWFWPRVGGIELHLRDLAARLRATGHDVVVITPTPGADVVDGTRVIRIDAPRAPYFDFLTTPAGVRAIGDALSAERPDIAHCHVSIISPAALGGARQANMRGVPLVVTFHSLVPQTRLLARATSAALGASRWRACFSAVSRRVASDTQPMAGARPMSILSNGIDASFWRGESLSRPQGEGAVSFSRPKGDENLLSDRSGAAFQLISVMRLNPKKRPLALIDTMRRLRTSVPDREIRLRIVGDGPLRQKLERAIATHGFAGRIELLGHRTREEIRALHAESDVFVLPTIRESFGLAALEARCAGLPVVAMRASGVAETIAHDTEGLLAGSDAEIATHIASLVMDDSLRKRIAAHNRATVPPFDWATVIDAHLAIYRDAIALRASVRAEKTR